jgi:phosphoribosylamine--glycine ligase
LKILVVGNGGRECAVASALLLSPKVTRLYITPANYGVNDPFGRGRVRVEDIPATDIERLLAFALEEGINLIFVGPEAPLALGITDAFREQGLRIVGPDRESSRLEAEKSYSKDFMRRHGIPTPASEVFTDFDEACRFLGQVSYPVVVKADGLAAGKGVVICKTPEFARETLEQMMVDDVFKGAGKKILIEQYITGPEISFFCFFDGTTAVMMPPASDSSA